eukprot:1633004-Prymnesium_polylepis.1
MRRRASSSTSCWAPSARDRIVIGRSLVCATARGLCVCVAALAGWRRVLGSGCYFRRGAVRSQQGFGKPSPFSFFSRHALNRRTAP